VARTILVIGGGPAGTFAAIAAKQQDPAATVTLLTCEPCEPYEKPPLSKAVLLGSVAPADAPIAGPGGVAGHAVVLQPLARCTAIDRADRAVVLHDGCRLHYDALVIATGSAPRQIPCLPIGMPGVHYLRSEADARALRAALHHSRHLLVVGGGLIGLEVAASAATLGVTATVLEVAPRILARVCDEQTGAVVQAAHARHGVEIRVGTTLASVTTQADRRIAAVTGAGDDVSADLVVVGTGSAPDDALAAAAGLVVSDGIVVDERCRTSDASIFAAGDAVRFPGPDGLVRLENWRHAQDQGAVAGRNAAGASEAYQTVPSFWSEQYDLYIQGVGWPAAGRTRVHRAPGGDPLRRSGEAAKADGHIVFEIVDGRVVYAMGINAQRDLAAVRRLIERRVPIDPAALGDPAQSLAAMLKRA
jgi:3-phenylpropionate/trans-cinnamate dioxygenase ferredoxin reductase component